MEHNPSSFGAETPSSQAGEAAAGKKKSKKEAPAARADKEVKPAKKEAAKKIAETNILDQLSAELPKSRKSSGKKAEKPEPVESEATDVSSEPTANESLEPADTGKPEKKQAETSEVSGEIPLDDDSRAAAEGYIKLREEEVETEIAEVGDEQPVATEAAADATLLEHAEEEIAEAPDGSSALGVIDEAYQETLDELPELIPAPEQLPAPTAPPVLAETAASTPDPVIVEQFYQSQAEAPSPTAVLAESSTSDEPSRPTQHSWYDVRPNTWSAGTSQPEKTVETSTVQQIERAPLPPAAASAPVVREAAAPNDSARETAPEQFKAVEQHIDRREAQIRQAAKEQYFARQPYAEAAGANVDRVVPEVQELPPPTNLKLPEKSPPVRVDQMSHRDLLKASEKVIVDGVSLRTIYEAKQITESGLQRVMHEYYRGGDIKRSLDQELLAKEMSYERDPQVRDRLAQSYASVQSAAQQSQPVSPIFEANQPAKPAAGAQDVQPAATRRQSNASVSMEQLVSYVWGGLIVILAVVALIIWLSK